MLDSILHSVESSAQEGSGRKESQDNAVAGDKEYEFTGALTCKVAILTCAKQMAAALLLHTFALPCAWLLLSVLSCSPWQCMQRFAARVSE